SFGLLFDHPLFQLFLISGSSDVYFLVLLSCAVNNLAAMFLSVFKGIQRMDKSNSIEIKISILNAVGTVLFLEAGWGMFGLAVNALINVCCAFFFTWWTVQRVIPEISLAARFDGKLLKEMFAFGVKMQV